MTEHAKSEDKPGEAASVTANTLTVQPVALLKDNYAWLIWSPDRKSAVVVDPGEAAPVQKVLGQAHIAAILLTHYHADHIAGAQPLAAESHAPIYGPANTHPTHVLKGGETLHLFPQHGLEVKVLDTPGHAAGHLSYFVPEVPALFTGDTLFSAGCGRLFDGTPTEMYGSFQQYNRLPPQTLVCPGHEYTSANLAFVAGLPQELGVPLEALKGRQEEVQKLRAEGQPSVPVRLSVEQATNPFLRAPNAEILSVLRSAKDKA